MPTLVPNDRYLRERNGRWYYYRRVPDRFAAFDPRGIIRTALKTSSLETARIRRDALMQADDEYWALLAIAADGGKDHAGRMARQRYAAARSHAMAIGFAYKPMALIVEEQRYDELLQRLDAIEGRGAPDEPERRDAEALLGTVPQPRARVSEAFRLYCEEIAFDEQFNKSPHQKKLWRNTKERSIAYFIEVIGDLPMADITRDHALEYHRYWTGRMRAKGQDAPLTPNTANRRIGDMRTLYTAYFKHIGEEEQPNPFRGLFFKGKSRKEVPAFPDAWVRQRLLAPLAFKGLNLELTLACLMLIETGCRPSEIINLLPEDIRLDEDVPHISIRPKPGREIKTETSIRDIPLVGVSLEAARRARDAFPHYRDRNNLFSASLVKALRNRGLFPTRDHVVYSFRHAFEKRMQEANIDYGLRCLLMGHKTNRPAYGDGGSLGYRRDELLKIAHPFDADAVFSHLDGSA